MSGDSKADEPDMEEILTSIRRIISDGDYPDSGPENAAPQSGEQAPFTQDRDEVFHLTDKLDEGSSGRDFSPSSEPRPGSEETFVSDLEGMVPQKATDLETGAAFTDERMPNISESLEAISNLIGVKDSGVREDSPGAKSPEAQFLEDLAAETLRREIKTWLDENLPGLVERLVREEIENLLRLAGNRR